MVLHFPFPENSAFVAAHDCGLLFPSSLATEWHGKELHGQPNPVVRQKVVHNYKSHFSSLALSILLFS